jgi:acetyl esterase/lipase
MQHILNCLKFAIKLIKALSKGSNLWQSFKMLIQLITFSLFLIPGWIRMAIYYIYDPYIIRNIKYGDVYNRNLLDIYLTSSTCGRFSLQNCPKGVPVVIFCSGGAWIIGYKMWSCLVGRGLSKLGILCVIPDYRNFPQGDIEDMKSDINSSINWTINNVHIYGGDPDNIILAGQSAGAHIIMCLMVEKFKNMLSKTSNDIENKNSNINSIENNNINNSDINNMFDLKHIKLVIGVSGPFNLTTLATHFHNRGLDSSILQSICKNDLKKYSPTMEFIDVINESKLNINQTEINTSVKNVINQKKINKKRNNKKYNKKKIGKDLKELVEIEEIKQEKVIINNETNPCFKQFPPVALFHGSNDLTIPIESVNEFASVLREGGGDVNLSIYKDSSHTDSTLEGLLGGDCRLCFDIAEIIEKIIELPPVSITNPISEISSVNCIPVMVHPILIYIAKKINPF